MVSPDEKRCEKCDSSENIRTRECEIKGWVGIQRYDDQDKFGIDFIRNGRAILIGEKESVFTWTPEATGEKIKEYPVDGIYGRIIGEVEINHVPTDISKTDFQKTSPEWSEVIKYLRGESSVLPETRQRLGEPDNDSPIFKLFQGYRKVRTPGRTDMYMGYWDEVKGGQNRISREAEKDLYERFLRNEPGYGPKDDSAWWALVEKADMRPVPKMIDCPKCGFQNLEGSELCQDCRHLFKSKNCIECEKKISQSEVHCPYCGKSQVPEDQETWFCGSCTRKNAPEVYKCINCGQARDVENTLKFEYLKENSVRVDELSNESLSVKLPGNISMSAIQLKVYYTDFVMQKDGFRIPAIAHSLSNELYLFLDQGHPVYSTYQDRPEDIISIEVAKWIWHNYQGSIPDKIRPLWSLSNIYFLIHSEVWGKRVELNHEEVTKDVIEFFKFMGDTLPSLLRMDGSSIFDNMDDNEQSNVIEYLHKNNLLNRKDELINNGEYLKYLPAFLMIKLFDKYPNKFFDGNFWNEPFEKLDVPDSSILEKIKKETAGKYHRCLEDMLSFSEYRTPDTSYARKISQTLRMVKEHLEYKTPSE
ncbi:hypothetical protein ACFLRX_08230 [Acidobacteriota bacterium]